MENLKKYIAVLLQGRQLYFTTFLALVYFFYFLIVFSFSSPGFILAVLLIILPLIGYEMSIRAMFLLIYGHRWRYSLFNYFFEDHEIYGHVFKKSATSAEINFRIVDKFIFKINDLAAPATQKKLGKAKFTVNSLGFRGKEFSQKKENGVIRIFCSGGSTTAGNSVDDEDTWPAVLEQKLRMAGYSAEVVNAGVQGWDSYQELQRFLHEIVNYDPDIILLHQGYNDEWAYTSQNLGKWWRPKVVRNVIEARQFSCGKHPLLSNVSTKSILFFFIALAYFRNFIFLRKMKFSNPRRWECLKSEKYIIAWFDNIMRFAEEASKRDILLYTINYPALPDIDDSFEVRSVYAYAYAKNAKRAPFAHLAMDYTAAGKKLIRKQLISLQSVIPCIDAEKDFSDIRGEKRLNFFIDDIHMSASGNKMLAESVAKSLIKDAFFNKLTKKNLVAQSNIRFDQHAVEVIKKAARVVDDSLGMFINGRIEELKRIKRNNDDEEELPTDRYTLF